MIIANGGYNTKQSIGIYGNSPPKEEWGNRDDSKIQESILKKILPAKRSYNPHNTTFFLR